MFAKVLGTAFIMAGFGGWGLLGARRIEKRVEQIKNVRLAMGFLEKEITYMHTPLSRALERTAKFCKPPVSHLFRESADRLKAKNGSTACEAWMSGIKVIGKTSELKRSDIEILTAIAPQLGMSDAGEQRKIFTLIQEELRIQEESALQEMESGRKLWSYGGFILGALVVILLL
ncbi:MAG: hypothetical protein H5T98_02085 [Syntrophomonadaceae bacterium]|nr:hypothetical protein [Syntrophomonadaceae bacterium]